MTRYRPEGQNFAHFLTVSDVRLLETVGPELDDLTRQNSRVFVHATKPHATELQGGR